MSPATVPEVSLGFLDALMASDDVWIQAADEGRAVAEHIIGSDAPIVVLYGPARSGSTEFMRRWVVPVLEERGPVRFHPHGEPALAPADDAAVEVWDGFETWLSDASPLRDAFLQELAIRTANGGGGRKFVLVLQEDYLNRLFPLRWVVPGILDDLFEIPTMPPSRFIDALARAAATYQMQIDDACRAVLARDLDNVRTKAALGAELVAILVFELYRLRTASTELSKPDYEALGGLTGILEGHLEFLLEHLPDAIDPDIGWAVLCAALRTPVAVATDLADIAHRYDVAIDVPARVLSWLEQDRHVLRSNTGGGHDVVPALLAAGVEIRARRVEESTDYVRAALRHAVRQHADFGDLLPDQQFRRINAQRSALVVTDDEATLMLRCALGYVEGQLGNAAQHWLRRVRNASATVEILLDALFDSRPDVRRRAAECLHDFDTADVRAQLHLVALRDTEQEVRAAAANSLAAIGTPELRASLVQETTDPNSPFRLQAIDALRVFTDQRSVDALVALVSGAAAGDPAARARAIDALGAQDTPQSASALVTIALCDKDGEDRAAAARAVGCVGSPEAASVALSALREARDASRVYRRPPLSWSDIRSGAVGTTMAIGAVLINFVAHGFILATIGRRRSAAAVMVAEAVLLGLAYTSGRSIAVLLIVTWAAGYIAPTSALLLERHEGVNQTRYRRFLGIALFAAGCVTGFLLVHGLPSMLVRQIRRGLLLTAFQAGAIVLIVSSSVVWNELGVATESLRPVFPVTALATRLLFWTGIAVVATTYLLGVGSALLDIFAWRRRREIDQRLDLVYRPLLQNPRASALILGDFCGADPDLVRASTSIVRRYPKVLRAQLRALWETADTSARQRIVQTMAYRPDVEAVEFLQSVSSARGGRLRAGAAIWNLRLSMWPRPVLSAALLALVTLVLYTAILHESTEVTPKYLGDIARSPQSSDDEAVEAIQALAILARTGPPRLSDPAASELQLTLSYQNVRENATRASTILDALPPGTGIDPIEIGLTWFLESPSTRRETREAAFAALKELRTPLAADSLRHFVEGAGSPRPWDADDVDLREPAIAALATMTESGVAPLYALLQLQSSPALPGALQQAAKDAAGGADALAWSEYHVEQSQFDEAIATAQNATRSSGDPKYATRKANALARAYALRGLAAMNDPKPDYARVTSDFSNALLQTREQGSPAEVITLGQRLGFALHERAKAYDQSYDVWRSLAEVSRGFGERFANEVEAGVAENSLTTGRYEDAYKLALQVIDGAGQDPQQSATVLSMKLIAAAARAVQDDDAGAERWVKDALEHHARLPQDYSNRWEYTGTLAYLDTVAMSPPVRTLLKNAFNQIARPPSRR